MDLIFQFLRIMVFCFAGELCYNFLPLPIPASVYGLLLLLAALKLGWVKLEQVRTAALFLIGIFPLLFVPAAAGVMDLWAELHAMLLPVLIALVPVLAFTWTPWVAVAGVLCWGAANGLQDSTVKALVADLVEPGRRATAYGVFAAIQGAAAIVGGAAAGFLYERSLPVLVTLVAATQLAAAILLSIAVGRHKIQ